MRYGPCFQLARAPSKARRILGTLSYRDQARGAQNNFLSARTEGKSIAVPSQKALLQVDIALIGALCTPTASRFIIGPELHEHLSMLADT